MKTQYTIALNIDSNSDPVKVAAFLRGLAEQGVGATNFAPRRGAPQRLTLPTFERVKGPYEQLYCKQTGKDVVRPRDGKSYEDQAYANLQRYCFLTATQISDMIHKDNPVVQAPAPAPVQVAPLATNRSSRRKHAVAA